MKSNLLLGLAFALFIGLAFSACETPTTTATTTTYSDVSSIINAKCAVSGCHDATTAAKNVDCSSYSSMSGGTGKTNILTTAASGFNDRVFVTAPLMPLGGGSLTQAEKDLLQAWVNNNYAQ